MPTQEKIAGTKKVAGTSKVSGSRRQAVSKVSGPDYSRYQVKTKGFTEQYTELAAARKSFDAIKRKKIAAEEVFKVTLSGKNGSEWGELDFCNITADHYE